MKMNTMSVREMRNAWPSLVNCSTSPLIPCPSVECAAKQEEPRKEQTMYNEDFDCDTDNSLRYLNSRLYVEKSEKTQNLRKKYALDPMDSPTTAEEFIKRITSGKYTVASDNLKKETYDPTRYITWYDPANPKDEEGFSKAYDALQKAYVSAVDTVTVITDEATRLKTLQDFESTTIQ